MRIPARAWFATRRGKRVLAGILSTLSAAMLIGAGWLGGYPFYTDWRAGRQQADLLAVFDSSAFRSAFTEGDLAAGSPFTRLVIPKLGVDIVVVEGTSSKALAAGAGHYPGTPLPGEEGNIGIAGHRNINGKPFGALDRLRPGDRVELWTPVARHIYEVVEPLDGHSNPWITAPNDWSVVAPLEGSFLTLTTCHPYGTAKERLVARAELISTEALV